MSVEEIESIRDLPTLETLCEKCDGKGGEEGDVYSAARWYPCPECEGTGYVLTEFGERLFGFLRRMPRREQSRSRIEQLLGAR